MLFEAFPISFAKVTICTPELMLLIAQDPTMTLTPYSLKSKLNSRERVFWLICDHSLSPIFPQLLPQTVPSFYVNCQFPKCS